MTIDLTGSGDCLQVNPGETDTGGINVVSLAASTVSNVVVDAATNNWSGADNVGLVHINSDAALADAGASLLQVVHATGQPISAGEGFLARFVSTGTARTNAHAVEIETTNTQPTLMLNNLMTITGADSAGTLLAITGNDTTGNSDTVTINHDGTEDGLQITCDGTTSVALHAIGATSQTTALVEFDGATGTWLGANGVAMVEVWNDGTPAHANASLMSIAQSGTNASGQVGICIRLEDTSTSGGGTEYAGYIASTNNEALFIDSGTVLIDETLVATKGLQVGVGETLTANSDSGAGSTVDDDITVANVTAANAGVNDWITLPNDPTIGTVVKVMCNVGANFEIRTLEAGDDKINNVDTSDGGTEYLATDGDMIIFTCVKADNWQAVSYPLAGGVRAAVTPD
jgi:hypothetical protein